MEINNSFKTGFITLIGRPNVGKSTLMNHLIGQKIAITSNKPQTTRNRIMTVYTDDDAQMIFLDTPGINETKNALGEYMSKVAKSAIEEVDMVLWLVEPSTYIGEVEKSIIEELKTLKKPVILVINKIDTVPAEKLELFENAYKKEMSFSKIVHVAALKGQNIDGVMDVIKEFLPVGPPFYDEDTITDQPERDIVAEIIREKALRLLKDEVPHGIAVTIESMKMREKKVVEEKSKKKRHYHPPKQAALDLDAMLKDAAIDSSSGMMDIDATIICEKDSHKGIVIGKGGAMLKKIGTAARKDIEDLLQCQVNLQIWVKVRKDWRDDKTQMKSFGYDVNSFKK